MAAPVNRRRVATPEYKAATEVLADSLGWKPKDIFYHWQQLAWLLEFESKWPRAVAEYTAFEYAKQIFDKRGQAAS